MSLGSFLGKLALLQGDGPGLALAWQALELARRADAAARQAVDALKQAEGRGALAVVRAEKAERELAYQKQARQSEGAVAAGLLRQQDADPRAGRPGPGTDLLAEDPKSPARRAAIALLRAYWLYSHYRLDHRGNSDAVLQALMVLAPDLAQRWEDGEGAANILRCIGAIERDEEGGVPPPPALRAVDRCPDIRTPIQRAAAILDRALPLADGADSGDVLLWIRAARRYAQALQHRPDALTAVRQAIQRLRDERRYYAAEGEGVLTPLAEALGQAEVLLSIEPGSADSKGTQP